MGIIEDLSRLAVRHLSEQRLRRVRTAYLAMRSRIRPVLRTVYGSFDSAQLRDHLEARVGADFEILMVHSSIDHMQPMYQGTAIDLVRMLVQYCAPNKTLAMPAFFFGASPAEGAYATFEKNPRFDLRRTPSMMGIITEVFRRWDGVIYSRNPIYRISALGPLARELTHGHEHAETLTGLNTPFDFMARHRTLILGIGKAIDVVTQAHHAEAVLGDAFPVPCRQPAPLKMVLRDGPLEIPYTLSGTGYQWRFEIFKLRKIMGPERLREWTFHGVPMFATYADEVTQCLIDAARSGVTLYEPS